MLVCSKLLLNLVFQHYSNNILWEKKLNSSILVPLELKEPALQRYLISLVKASLMDLKKQDYRQVYSGHCIRLILISRKTQKKGVSKQLPIEKGSAIIQVKVRNCYCSLKKNRKWGENSLKICSIRGHTWSEYDCADQNLRYMCK